MVRSLRSLGHRRTLCYGKQGPGTTIERRREGSIPSPSTGQCGVDTDTQRKTTHGERQQGEHVRIKTYRHLCWHPTRKSPNHSKGSVNCLRVDKPKH